MTQFPWRRNSIKHLRWSFFAKIVKGELHSNDIFLHFALIGLECDSITLFTKMNFFCLPKLTFQHHLHNIYIAFYLLTWTYFNDVNGDKNILINSQLKRILFMSSDKKKWTKTEKHRKNKEKENNSDESDFSENEIPDLNSLKPFEFELKKQTSEILTVVAVMMRKKVLDIKYNG